MKQLIFSISLVLYGLVAEAQAPYIQWKKCYGGTSLDNALSIVQLPDSGFAAAGTSGSGDGDIMGAHGLYDFWMVKMSSTGAITWQKSYGGSMSDNCNFIQATADHGYILGGNSRSADGDVASNNGGYDFWIVKIDAAGAIQWTKSLGSTGFDFLHCIRELPDGNFIAAGRNGSNGADVTDNHGGLDVWVVKLSSTGGLLWKKSYGGTADDDGAAVYPAPGGGYIVAGNTESNDGDVTGNHGGDDIWVFKISDTGTLLWQKCLGGTGDDDMVGDAGSGAMQVTADSGIVVAGWTGSNDGDVTGNHGYYDLWVARLDPSGGIVWEHCYGGTDDDAATSLQQTSDSGFAIAGTTYSNDGDVSGNHGGYDFWLVKLSAGGTLQWQKCMGGTGISPGDCANSMLQALGGGYILAGQTSANDYDVSGNHGDFDFWVVRLNCLSPEAGPVTGDSVLCQGATITLADTAAGGSWHIQNGNVSVSGGVVTGVSAGSDIVTYYVANTCGSDFATHAVTVNPLPVPVISVAGSVLSTTAPFTTYQWMSGSAAITGATNATYTATSSGTYAVSVTDANGCTGTSTAVAVTPVEVHPAADDGISICPNPSAGLVHLTGISDAEIEIYSPDGRKVSAATGCNIDISALPPGPYLIRVTSQGTLVLHEKLVRL